MLLTLLTGGLAGAIHVVTGPDHLAVLAPFSVEARRRAWTIGLRWGLGHASGLLVVAIAAYAVRDQLALEPLSRLSEFLIGGVLLAVGAWGLLHFRRDTHTDSDATHAHENGKGETHLHTTAALLTGTVHGIAGTGSVLAVVPVLAMPTWFEAAAYLFGFGGGTVAGMVAFAAFVGWITPRDPASGGRVYRSLFLAASLAALALGAIWIALPLLGIDVHGHAPTSDRA